MTPSRRLILLRHAKSAHGHGQPDHERPLTERGLRDSPKVGAELTRLGWVPELVFSSDATRTRQTWLAMADTLAVPGDQVTFTDKLYLTGIREIRESAFRWPDSVETILCIGHNFGWQDAVSELAQANDEMTTCNAACLLGSGDSWVDALADTFQLMHWVRPRDL